MNLGDGQYWYVGQRWTDHTQDPSETESTRGASGDVAGDTRGILSPLVDPCDVPCQFMTLFLLIKLDIHSRQDCICCSDPAY